jgi:5-formyltetrahydrofolate cyclo-ligase
LNAQPEQALAEIERAKQEVRDRIWALLDREGAAKPPGTVVGKIPNFLGAEAAAEQLVSLPVWRTARVLKANPEKAQRAVRAKALIEGKVLYMAVPRLADELPFYLLEPEHLTIPPWEAASKEGAAKAGRKVAANELRLVDLVICGSVAVNREGARVGKGGGFSDLEVAFLVEAGVLQPSTVLATTVHPLQVVDEPAPRDHPRLPRRPRRHPGRGHLVRQAAAAPRNPLGASAPRQDRRSSGVGRPGSPTLRDREVADSPTVPRRAHSPGPGFPDKSYRSGIEAVRSFSTPQGPMPLR